MSKSDLNPTYSFIVPIYNSEIYISKCLDSILLQKTSQLDYEVILIDDGSKDHSREICDYYSKCYDNVHVIHKKNEGVAIARKNGIEAARGNFIVCVDSDDWIDDGLLVEANEILKKKNPDIFIYGMKYTDKKGRVNEVNPYRKGYYTKSDLEKEIFPMLIQRKDAVYFHSSVWGAIIKRSLFLENILSNKHATIGEDQASMIACVANSQSMYVMNGCYYHYRYNQNSATKERKAFDWQYPEVVNKHIIAKVNLDLFDFRAQLYRKICHDLWNCAYTQFYSNKSYKVVSHEIKNHLNEDFYQKAINKAEFKGTFKAYFMMYALKRQFIPAFFFYSNIRLF